MASFVSHKMLPPATYSCLSTAFKNNFVKQSRIETVHFSKQNKNTFKLAKQHLNAIWMEYNKSINT